MHKKSQKPCGTTLKLHFPYSNLTLLKIEKNLHLGPLPDSLTELIPMFPALICQAGSTDLILNFGAFA